MSHLGRTESGKTLLSIVLMHDNGQHTFLSSGMMHQCSYALAFQQLTCAAVVSIASMFVPPFHNPGPLIRAARTAKEAGAIVCADCGFPRHGVLSQDFLPAFPIVRIFILSGEKWPFRSIRFPSCWGTKAPARLSLLGERSAITRSAIGLSIPPTAKQRIAMEPPGGPWPTMALYRISRPCGRMASPHVRFSIRSHAVKFRMISTQLTPVCC